MNVLGIIAEYNPFHNGHLYHLEESKKAANADYTIAIISGNFSQRGNTSIVDKWAKTEMALSNGIDLVIELPTIYSISSAENFADGAIKILNALKIVDTISFGAETNDIAVLDKFANILYTEPKEYVSILNHELSKGVSYPKARENALLLYLNDIRRYANILSNPNNILAIEYLKALKKHKSYMKPIAIKRNSVDYHDLTPFDKFASASAIRDMLISKRTRNLRQYIPRESYNILANSVQSGKYVLNLDKFEKEIIYTLRKMTIEQIADLPDVSEGLEHSIKKAANSCNSLQELINIIKSKRYTQTRIQRILLYALLGISKKDMMNSYKTLPYIRVLGMNSNGKKLLSVICGANPKLNIITSVKKFMDVSTNKNLKLMLEKDIFATNIYTLGFAKDSWANLDYTQKLITY